MIDKVSSLISVLNWLDKNPAGDTANLKKTGSVAESEKYSDPNVQDIVEIHSSIAFATENKQGKKTLELANTINRKNDPDIRDEEVQKLKKKDKSVKKHVQAHMAVAGSYIRGLSFQYRIGPDGRIYAVSAEVTLDITEVPGDPDATIVKAETIRRAAYAPTDPSLQDHQAASEATRMEAKARIKKSETT